MKSDYIMPGVLHGMYDLTKYAEPEPVIVLVNPVTPHDEAWAWLIRGDK